MEGHMHTKMWGWLRNQKHSSNEQGSHSIRSLENCRYDPESFLSKVLTSKYYPNTYLLRASTKTPKSAFWSSIIKLRHILISNSSIHILDGNSSIWSTPWFPLLQSIYDHLIMQPSHFKYPSQVTDLWTPNKKSWKANLIIYNLFDQQTADCIMQVLVINQEV